jgi:hypothetical protein
MSDIPCWLELQAEIDYSIWQLDQIRQRVSGRSNLDYMVDQATGYEAAMTADAEILMKRIRELMDEFNQAVQS